MSQITTISPSDIIHVPTAVAACPECGQSLYCEINEWLTDTREIGDAGVTVHCTDDNVWLQDSPPEERDGQPHRYWQGEWAGVDHRIEQWARSHFRIDVNQQNHRNPNSSGCVHHLNNGANSMTSDDARKMQTLAKCLLKTKLPSTADAKEARAACVQLTQQSFHIAGGVNKVSGDMIREAWPIEGDAPVAAEQPAVSTATTSTVETPGEPAKED